MKRDAHIDLIELCDKYAEHHNLSHWRVAFLARGDGQFFDRLKKGKSCTVVTANLVQDWFSKNWPKDLEWPADIPRPETRSSEKLVR